MDEKKVLRRQLIAKMAELPKEYMQQADENICQRILALKMFQKAEIVFCYIGVGQEIDTWPIIEAGLRAGKTIAVPKCLAKGVMSAYAITGKEDLIISRFGLLEPSKLDKLILPQAIELCLIPCVACNTQGLRLGWGGGYYDRYLSQASFDKVVLCREEMLYHQIPREPHDVLADMVVTEKAIYRKKAD